MNYRSQPVFLGIFYFTCINSGSAETVQEQEAIWCVYGSIRSEGHKPSIFLVTKAELVVINYFSSPAAFDFCLEQTAVIHAVFMLNSNEKGV